MPQLTREQIDAIRDGELSMDALVRECIIERFTFRFGATDDYSAAIRISNREPDQTWRAGPSPATEPAYAAQPPGLALAAVAALEAQAAASPRDCSSSSGAAAASACWNADRTNRMALVVHRAHALADLGAERDRPRWQRTAAAVTTRLDDCG
jgi:hypothetical protein